MLGILYASVKLEHLDRPAGQSESGSAYPYSAHIRYDQIRFQEGRYGLDCACLQQKTLAALKAVLCFLSDLSIVSFCCACLAAIDMSLLSFLCGCKGREHFERVIYNFGFSISHSLKKMSTLPHHRWMRLDPPL